MPGTRPVDTMAQMPEIAEHPLLDAGWFVTRLPAPLGELTTPQWLAELLDADAETPLQRSEELRQAVRRMLRHGGYRPTGRGKPSSEYLLRAAGEGKLGPINPCVDACNAASLHSGLPISVVDLDRVRPPLRIDLAGEGAAYVFNPAGQEIRLEGLLCLFDAAGPCANAVKDAQRTKTGPGTRRTLSVVWGTAEHPGQTRECLSWYRGHLERLGASTEEEP